MLAEVRPLRNHGRPLERTQVRAMTACRGELSVFKRHDPWRGQWVPVAALVGPDGHTYVLPPLDQVRIARWEGADLVLVGLEQPDPRAGTEHRLQSWWCRLLTDPAPRRTPAPAANG